MVKESPPSWNTLRVFTAESFMSVLKMVPCGLEAETGFKKGGLIQKAPYFNEFITYI